RRRRHRGRSEPEHRRQTPRRLRHRRTPLRRLRARRRLLLLLQLLGPLIGLRVQLLHVEASCLQLGAALFRRHREHALDLLVERRLLDGSEDLLRRPLGIHLFFSPFPSAVSSSKIFARWYRIVSIARYTCWTGTPRSSASSVRVS